MRKFLLLFIIMLFALYFGLSWYFASQIIVFNAPEERTAEWIERYAPDWDVPLTETVEIQSGDNLLVADVYDNPAEGDCAVIIVHGLGGERSLVRQYGSLFYDLGCDVMSYDFAPWHNDVFLTYGYNEKDDLLNVVNWFAEYTGLPTENIGIWAESYGAVTTLLMLPEFSDLAWVISDSAYASMSGIINHQAQSQFGSAISVMIPGAFFVAGQRANFSIADVSAVDAVSQVDLPLLIIHSEADDYTPYENSQEIYDAANPDTSRLVLTDWGAGHTQSYVDNKPAYTEIVYSFLADLVPDFGNQEEINNEN